MSENMLEVFKLERPAGENQLIVAFVNRDETSQIDVEAILEYVATDAAAKAREGWHLVSVGGLPMRQMGTAGNIMFQSGGQYATQVAVVAVYARDVAKKATG
jgi:hypothetical protein